MLQEPNYIELIANELWFTQNQVETVLELVKEWATVPFIARYRKEKTWNLDENQIRSILELQKKEENLFKWKQTAINWIQEQWKLTDELQTNIVNAITLKEVEDIYKPYKSKKKTKAMIAKEKWLEPVAKLIRENIELDKKIIESKLSKEDFDKIKELTEEEILEWASEIIGQDVNENASLRDFLRKDIIDDGFLTSKIKWEKTLEKLTDNIKSQMYKFDIYKDFSAPYKKAKSYQILAINRWEKLWILNVKLESDNEEAFIWKIVKEPTNLYKEAIKLWYKKLYKSVENELRWELTSKAEDDGILTFQSNLWELLMTKPIYDKMILAIDPWYRTWSKIVVLDKLQKPIEFSKIYLHRETQAKAILKDLLKQVDVVVIWNGTASDETAELVQSIKDIPTYIVNESWASVYSASKVAEQEFPDLDLTDRWTISIWRRYIDPLSELVKVPVWSIWVGMYQHDMLEKKLEEKLWYVIEDVVNQVWINVNTASIHVLKNISWIDLRTAKKIYNHRPYASRKDLEKILSSKVYEQAIWFLRVPESKEKLDNTDIHPEQYELARFLESHNNYNMQELEDIYPWANKDTIEFIQKALENIWKDPRVNSAHKKAWKKVAFDELKEWDVLEWIVRNILAFGVFVDIWTKNDGLVHISQIADEYIKDPADHVKVWETVKVKITWIDKEKWKLQLSMKEV